MTEIGGVKMHFGTSSGSARKALRVMEEPHIMLNAQSRMGVPWDGIDHLFVDSGGYSLMLEEGEHPPVDEYLDIVEGYGAEMWAVQDYPCEPEILSRYGRSVRDHQHMTTAATAECIVRAEERDIDGEPVAVLQGWELQDYLHHIDQLSDEGLLTEHIGIGSVCRRNQTQNIRRIVKTIRKELPSRHKLHAFGVKNEILNDRATRESLWSADTTAWYFRNYNNRNDVDDTWQEMVSMYLKYRQGLAEIAGCLHQPKAEQSTIHESVAATDGGNE